MFDDIIKYIPKSFNTLADDTILALGAFQRKGKVFENLLNSGIKLCKELIKGYDLIKANKGFKYGEIMPYEKYMFLATFEKDLEKKKLTADKIIKKLISIEQLLNDIKTKKRKIIKRNEYDRIMDILITISSLYWRKSMNEVCEKREKLGLKLYE